MSVDLTARHSPPAERTGPTHSIGRPAELVELSERVYRGIFGAGLSVTAVLALYSLALVFVQVDQINRPIAAALCLLLATGSLIAAHQRERLYASLRRHPTTWMPLVGLALCAAHVAIGPGSQVLFPPTLTLIGTLGAAIGLRWVLLAGLLASAGQASPVLTHTLSSNDERALITAAAADVFIPLLYAALIGHLARFMLELHRTLTGLAAKPAEPLRVKVKVGSPRPASSAATSVGDEIESAASSPRVVTPRQLQAIALAAEGLQHAEIADCLQTSTGQVTRLLSQARDRAGVPTTQALVNWAVNSGLLPPPG